MSVQARRISLMADLCLIVASIAVCGVLAKQHLPFLANSRKLIRPGTKLTYVNMEWDQHSKTLVIALREGCHFCSDSAPFYRRLVSEAGTRNVRVVAVFPHRVDAGRKYLASLEVPVSDVREADFSALGVGGTPTLLMVDREGTVTNAWLGELSREKEDAVLALLSRGDLSSDR